MTSRVICAERLYLHRHGGLRCDLDWSSHPRPTNKMELSNLGRLVGRLSLCFSIVPCSYHPGRLHHYALHYFSHHLRLFACSYDA